MATADPAVVIRKPFPLWLTAAVLAGAILLSIVTGVLGLFGAFLTHVVDFEKFRAAPLEDAVYAQTLGYFPVLIYLAYLIPWLATQSWSQLGLRPPGARDLKWAVAAGVAMLIIVDGTGSIAERVFHLKAEEAQDFLKASASPVYLWTFIVMGSVLAPVSEELAFRILLFNALRTRMTFWIAAFISGAVFAGLHFSLGSLVPLTLGGIILAYAYDRTRCVWTPMIAHGLFNGIGIAIAIRFGV